MKTELLILCSILWFSCRDNEAKKYFEPYYYVKTSVFKNGKSIANAYDYAFGIGSIDTIIRPVYSKDLNPFDNLNDTIIPLVLDVFHDTTTFVLVDKEKLRDTFQISYFRNFRYYNSSYFAKISNMKIHSVSHRIDKSKSVFNLRGETEIRLNLIRK